jgi:hypothetical protein
LNVAVLQQSNEFGTMHGVEPLEQRTLKQVLFSHGITLRTKLPAPQPARIRSALIKKHSRTTGGDLKHFSL